MIRRTLSAILMLAASAALAQERNSVPLHADAEREIVAPPAVVATNVAGFGTYAYDGAGNVTQAGDGSFVYDTRGRIEKAMIRGIAQTFTYDRWGNITNIATTGESDHSIDVGPNNRVSGATYDGSGNLLSYHGGTFVYDALNVVTESTPTGGNRHLYLYTASNERIATWTEDYIYRGSQLLAAEVPSSEKVRHFHLDHLGTPRLITGNGGAVIAGRTYGAFGRGLDVDSTATPDELPQFTGHERDSFQLDYMHARYYDPMMGRFLSIDPVLSRDRALHKPQAWNRYAYVENNPLKYVDRDGRALATSDCSQRCARSRFRGDGAQGTGDREKQRSDHLSDGQREVSSS